MKSNQHRSRRNPHSPAARGSLLIVAMILSAVIGISLVSYIQLSRTALALSNRSVYNNAAINLAEQGLEESVYALNQMVANPAYSWTGWQNPTAADTRRKWLNTPLNQNATGEFRAYIYNYAGTTHPKVVARALITLGGGDSPPIEKWIELQLTKTSKFSNGLVAKTNITFSGSNVTVDSWNSDPENDGVDVRPFSSALRQDNGSVGSVSIAGDAIQTWNAKVYGYVSTGGSDPTTYVGPNGEILGADSTPDASWVKANVDPNRVSSDFSATFDPVTAPTTLAVRNLTAVGTSLTLPNPATDTPAADGKYYYDATSINLASSDKIIINKDVVLRVSGAISTTGQSGIVIAPPLGSLAIYTPGNVNLGGNGIVNGLDASGDGALQDSELGQAARFQLWGTSTTSQSISIAGNGAFSGVVYAPEANVTIVGNGGVSGSVVANTITLTGNAAFHYDEALANFGGANPYRVSRWKELTDAADRAVYSAALSW